MPGWQLEPIGKWLPLEFFVKIIYATSMDPLFQQLFLLPLFLPSRKRLALIN